MSERATSGEQVRARKPRPGLRALNALLFGAFAAAGFGAVARRGWLFLISQGLLRPVLPWDVPLGAIFLALALALGAETLRTGALATSGRPLRARDRWPLLLLVVACFAARLSAAAPRPPLSPTPRLIAALRRCAETLDAGYREAHQYPLDEAALERALAALGPSSFVYRGHDLPLRARLLERDSAQREPLAGDRPGLVYVAHTRDAQRVWLSAVTLAGDDPAMLLTPRGAPLLLEARAGTHSAPGGDPLIPEYTSGAGSAAAP